MPLDAVARVQQRETAASLTQTSVRYLAFGLAIVLSVLVLAGARRIDTIIGGTFLAILLGFAIQRDMVSIEPWGLQGVVEEVSLRSVKLRSVHGEVIHVQNSQVLAARPDPARPA